jgi:hypothetical protein
MGRDPGPMRRLAEPDWTSRRAPRRAAPVRVADARRPASRPTGPAGPHGVRNSEWQVAGLGPYEKEPVSDNAVRRALKKDERPEYNGHPPR